MAPPFTDSSDQQTLYAPRMSSAQKSGMRPNSAAACIGLRTESLQAGCQPGSDPVASVLRGVEDKNMTTYFVIGDETTNIAGDPQCPECWEDYPETCSCGGLIHAAGEEDRWQRPRAM